MENQLSVKEEPLQFTLGEIVNGVFVSPGPNFNWKNDSIQNSRDNQFLVIEDTTFFGITTHIPRYLYEAGFCVNEMKICCTQPCDSAAISVATQVSKEMKSDLGGRVGYSVKYETKVSNQTLIKYVIF